MERSVSAASDGPTKSDGAVVRYEPDDRCPPLVVLGVGIQGVMLILASIVLIVAITARAGGQDDSYISWAVFAALIIAGVLTALQATRIPRFGAGHILLMGPTSSYIAVSALALDVGGQALLASLTVASALLCLMLSHWLPLLRRIITPVVSGTVLMLIAVSVLPLALDRIREVPDSVPRAGGPIIALVTLVVGTALALRAPRRWKPWSPLVTLGAGCGVAALFGAYDVQRVIDAGWFGIPAGGAPRLDLTPGPEFWTLLPAFAVVSLVGTLRSVGSNVAVQQASRRQSKVTDYRLVQSSLTTNGLGILLSGIAGSPPTTPYTSRSLSLITFTSVAARRVGYVVGASLAVLALFPKLAAVLVSIPSPVMAAYILTAIGMLFVTGINTLVKDGLDVQKTMVVAVAFGARRRPGTRDGLRRPVRRHVVSSPRQRRRHGRGRRNPDDTADRGHQPDAPGSPGGRPGLFRRCPRLDKFPARDRGPDRLERRFDAAVALSRRGDAAEPRGSG